MRRGILPLVTCVCLALGAGLGETFARDNRARSLPSRPKPKTVREPHTMALTFVKAWPLKAPKSLLEAGEVLEPSGAAWNGQDLWVVSDGPTETRLYRVDLSSDEPELSCYDLDDAEVGFLDYRETILPPITEALVTRRLTEQRKKKKNAGKDEETLTSEAQKHVADKYPAADFEGLARCENTYYLANERFRHVLRFDLTPDYGVRNLTYLPITFPEEARQGKPNSGFEGVAVDCENQDLYVALEREPRRIYRVTLREPEDEAGMSMYTVTAAFDLPAPASPPPVAHVGGGASANDVEAESPEVSADFSDLLFHEGRLFVLERNARRIAVVDSRALSLGFDKAAPVSAYLDFSHVPMTIAEHPTDGLFISDEPYGIAEGLAIQGDRLLLLLDSNQTPVNPKAQAKWGTLVDSTAGPVPGTPVALEFVLPDLNF